MALSANPLRIPCGADHHVSEAFYVSWMGHVEHSTGKARWV